MENKNICPDSIEKNIFDEKEVNEEQVEEKLESDKKEVNEEQVEEKSHDNDVKEVNEEKHEEDAEEILTAEEQVKIDSIEKVSFVQVEQEETKPEKKSFSFWSIFNFNFNPSVVAGAIGGNSKKEAPFDFQRRFGLKKVVTINNISGTNAYVILTPAKVKNVKVLGLGAGVGGVNVSANLEFEDKGDHKAQKISIANNSRSEYDLDNSEFYCTLFLNVDNEWRKTWDNRKFDGKRFDINILERHVKASLEKENIPNF